MYIRKNMDNKIYLVNEIADKKNKIIDAEKLSSFMDCSQDGFREYGDGEKIFLFVAMGMAGQPFVFDLIHAGSKEDAEKLIRQRYETRLGRTLVGNEVLKVTDLR